MKDKKVYYCLECRQIVSTEKQANEHKGHKLKVGKPIGSENDMTPPVKKSIL